jgi:vitamin B12 transporter
LRAEHSSIINKANFAPRISFAYKTGKQAQVSVAYGMFYQKPENTQLIATTNLGYTKATHYIANYQKMTKDYTLRAEIFHKKYDDLVKTTPSTNNNGTGYAQGFELFWRDKKTIKNFDYWISYSYLDTKRDYLNYPYEMTPNFAAKHTASLVTKKFVMKWKTGFNFTYTFATGRPYYNLMTNGSTGKPYIADQGKTKSYQNLGFSLNYVPSLGRSTKNFVVLVASITNVLNNSQVYGYHYSYNGLRKEAVTPTANRFFFIGAFFSWGVDRTQDAINNNL